MTVDIKIYGSIFYVAISTREGQDFRVVYRLVVEDFAEFNIVVEWCIGEDRKVGWRRGRRTRSRLATFVLVVIWFCFVVCWWSGFVWDFVIGVR